MNGRTLRCNFGEDEETMSDALHVIQGLTSPELSLTRVKFTSFLMSITIYWTKDGADPRPLIQASGRVD